MSETNLPAPGDGGAAITLAAFQRLIREMYFEKDLARGVDGTFMWLIEEVGEHTGEATADAVSISRHD